MYSDITLQIYSLIGFVSSMGFILFVYWMIRYDWYKSIVFVYVTILLFGESVRSWICMWGRHSLLTNPEDFIDFTFSWVWSGRLLLTLASVTAIVGHMCYRAITRDKTDRRV